MEKAQRAVEEKKAAEAQAKAEAKRKAAERKAAAQEPLKLDAIDVQTLAGQQVQLKLHLSGPAPEPLPFTIDKPARNR